MKVRLIDIIIMTLTVFGEASICDDYEQIKVAWVILNRSKKWGELPCEVCLAPFQFHCWRKNKYLYELIISLLVGGVSLKIGEGYQFARALYNVMYSCKYYEIGLRWGATYFHDNSISTPEKWKDFEIVEKTEHFTFYKEKERG
ncbi:hypothetical protein DRN34_00275 [Thermococci archaeon]|nr:MAG: hypothetical protein DRN34_00275 [Thermococci archaeon]